MEPQDILKLTPFFGAVLDQGELDRLAGKLKIGKFPRGAVIVRQGDTGASMFVVVDGKAQVTVHNPRGETIVAELKAGDLLGEMSLMTGARRSATVTATRQLVVLEIGKDALDDLLDENPDLIRRFADMIEQRQAELDRIGSAASAWNSIGMARNEIAARMTAFYRS